MRYRPPVSVLVVAVAALFGVPAASAHDGHGHRKGTGKDAQVVFVQTNQVSGNQIVVYDRADDGTLTPAGTYNTGGNGGAAAGAPSDKLASQGSLVYDAGHSLLFAVNAGSDSISAFRVHGDSLVLEDVVPSGGEFPASIAVQGRLVYVLNSGGSGIVQGFRIADEALIPLPNSARSLGLANAVPPNFLTSPGQVGFTPDGRQLIVTTKASTSTIDVFAVGPNGRLSQSPVANPSATPVPFAFTFDPAGRLVSGEAGASAVTTYTIGSDGTLTGAQSLSDGQVALCWVQAVGGYYYVANTGSNTLSGYQIDAAGQPSLIGATGVVATTEPGPIDLAASSQGAFLYGETGVTSTVDEYHVNVDGTLTKLGAVTGLPPGIEGIAAT
jgi:6-phosphogluconolactonase (cycloisomerase 2 family)